MSLVLVVDDDPVVRVALQNLLAAVGHEVVCAASVAEARVLLARDGAPFTRVVLDHDLPDGLGTEIAALLPATLPHAQVVMHSSHTFASAPYGVGRTVVKGPGLGPLLDVLDALAA